MAATAKEAAELTARQSRFVDEYLIDGNATQAAVRAGYSKKTAQSQGQRLLTNVDVAESIRRAQADRSKRTEITADAVLERWWQLANADPRELVEYHRIACDACHGGEPSDTPDPACPECKGYGKGKMVISDTRELSENAKALYAGVKSGKDGIEVKMRDQSKALENVAKHLGMFIDRTELTGKDGAELAPTQIVIRPGHDDSDG